MNLTVKIEGVQIISLKIKKKNKKSQKTCPRTDPFARLFSLFLFLFLRTPLRERAIEEAIVEAKLSQREIEEAMVEAAKYRGGGVEAKLILLSDVGFHLSRQWVVAWVPGLPAASNLWRPGYRAALNRRRLFPVPFYGRNSNSLSLSLFFWLLSVSDWC